VGSGAFCLIFVHQPLEKAGVGPAAFMYRNGGGAKCITFYQLGRRREGGEGGGGGVGGGGGGGGRGVRRCGRGILKVVSVPFNRAFFLLNKPQGERKEEKGK